MKSLVLVTALFAFASVGTAFAGDDLLPIDQMVPGPAVAVNHVTAPDTSAVLPVEYMVPGPAGVAIEKAKLD